MWRRRSGIWWGGRGWLWFRWRWAEASLHLSTATALGVVILVLARICIAELSAIHRAPRHPWGHRWLRRWRKRRGIAGRPMVHRPLGLGRVKPPLRRTILTILFEPLLLFYRHLWAACTQKMHVPTAQCMHVIPRDPMASRWLVVVVVAAASSQAAGADVCAKGVTSITDGGARPHSIPTHLKRHTQLFCHSAPPNKRANSTHMCRVVCVRSRPWTEFYSCVYSLLHHRVRPIAPAMCRASGCVCGLPPRRPHNKAKLLPKCDQAVGR